MAVYTKVSDRALAAFLKDYALGDVRDVHGIAEGIENTNYRLNTTDGRYILTLFEKRVAAADLPFFVELMEHLAGAGVPCPLPVRDRDGQALKTLADRPACIVTFLDGRPTPEIEPDHCAAVGRAIARLHLAGDTFRGRRDNDLGPLGWRALAGRIGAGADTIAPGLADGIAAELAELEGRWPDPLPQGVVHADLFPDNVFFDHGRITGLIDFYFACTDALAYDLAVCLNAWCFDEAHAFVPARAKRLLESYDAVRHLTGEEVAALPLLCRGAALRFLLTRVYDWLNPRPDALVTPKDPREYLAKLAFHQSVKDAADYVF